MASTFTWLDFSEFERRKMLDVISAFQERETRDELGIGVVRDAFANLFFPGTSTIQTRAKYFLFVPWIYVQLEEKKVPSSQVAQRARADEISLINALSKSDDPNGTIGIDARKSLQRLPSNIYWQGLGTWGIRHFQGSQSQYRRFLDYYYLSRKQIRRNDDGEPVEGGISHNWHIGLPERPAGFPDQVSFHLSKKEAVYLRERIMTYVGGTLMAFLIDQGLETDEIDFIWMHPQYSVFPKQIHEHLEHGRNFSEAIHGAALLYNLMLAEQSNRVELVDRYRDALLEWYFRLDNLAEQLTQWDRRRFWEIVISGGARVSNPTRLFIDTWLDIATSTSIVRQFADDIAARRLIHNRERFLKRGLARLDNVRARELWSGNAGTNRLNYRWKVAQVIVSDIIKGLSTGA